MLELALQAGIERACVDDDLLAYIESGISAAEAIAILDAYINGVTGLPLGAREWARAARTATLSSETQSTADADSTHTGRSP